MGEQAAASDREARTLDRAVAGVGEPTEVATPSVISDKSQAIAEQTVVTKSGARIPVLQHPAPNPAWLARSPEKAIDPATPIIDPHHHLWDRGGGYFLDEPLQDIQSGHNIVSTVFLQCAYGYRTDGPEALKLVGETEFVAALARAADARGVKARVCEGIVGHADLLLGDAVTPVLEAHIAAGEGRFRGVRHVTARQEQFRASIVPPPPAQVMSDPIFCAAYARLRQFDLSLDAWLYHTQIDEVADLARAFTPTSTAFIGKQCSPYGFQFGCDSSTTSPTAARRRRSRTHTPACVIRLRPTHKSLQIRSKKTMVTLRNRRISCQVCVENV